MREFILIVPGTAVQTERLLKVAVENCKLSKITEIEGGEVSGRYYQVTTCAAMLRRAVSRCGRRSPDRAVLFLAQQQLGQWVSRVCRPPLPGVGCSATSEPNTA